MTHEFGRWYPIAEAPKDGTRVMLTVEGYKGPRHPFSHPDVDADILHLARWIGVFWDPYIPNDWTHWMPLPPPPPADPIQRPGDHLQGGQS